MEKIDPLWQKMRIFRQKKDPFFQNHRHADFPFPCEIQNDDAYPLVLGVAGPGAY